MENILSFELPSPIFGLIIYNNHLWSGWNRGLQEPPAGNCAKSWSPIATIYNVQIRPWSPTCFYRDSRIGWNNIYWRTGQEQKTGREECCNGSLVSFKTMWVFLLMPTLYNYYPEKERIDHLILCIFCAS